MARYIRWLNGIGITDIPLAGSKNASLGKMSRELVPQDIPAPNGFAIIAETHCFMLDQTNTWDALDEIMRTTIVKLRFHFAVALSKHKRYYRQWTEPQQ